MNDLLRLGDGLERTDGAGSLDLVEGAGRLKDALGGLIGVLGRLYEVLGRL